jgi:hypothetical protein
MVDLDDKGKVAMKKSMENLSLIECYIITKESPRWRCLRYHLLKFGTGSFAKDAKMSVERLHSTAIRDSHDLTELPVPDRRICPVT